MTGYFWSARFICGAITLALGLALLIGGLLFLPYGRAEACYYAVVGATACLSAVLLATASLIGLCLYGLMVLGAVAWSLFEVGLDVWKLIPFLLALLLWGWILLLLRRRVAPPTAQERS